MIEIPSSFTEDFSISIDKIDEEWFTLYHEYMSCSPDKASQTVILYLEIDIKSVQLLTFHGAKQVLHHVSVDPTLCFILLGSLGAHLYAC